MVFRQLRLFLLICWFIYIYISAGGIRGACWESQYAHHAPVERGFAHPLRTLQASQVRACWHQLIFTLFLFAHYKKRHVKILWFASWFNFCNVNNCFFFFGKGRPGMFSPKERAKWDAWKAVEGKHLTWHC